MASSETQTVDRETIANDFRERMQGKLDEDKIDAAVEGITAATGVYPANGEIASMIFYVRVGVQVTGGKSFVGDGGGAFTPGGGALFGNVYTDDIDTVYGRTVSFEVNATPVYLSVLFFDSNSNLLGHFQSGGISTVTGVGGGTGSWS